MTAVFTHESFSLHETPNNHPERSERVLSVLNHLHETRLIEEVEEIHPEPVALDRVKRVHSEAFVDVIEQISPENSLVRIDADTSMGPHSLDAARRASGAVVEAVELAVSGRHPRSFCVVRPPGHHAESASAMGFCLFNSIAVAADCALESLDRVAILDFDVHHGNGTVEIFANRPEVLVCSSFQFPFYPYRYQELDLPNIVNTPLPAGTNGSSFRRAIERQWTGPLERHNPELILVSAGFDAHRDDPLGQIDLIDDDYRWMTDWIVNFANSHSNGRVVSALEGGYDLNALSRCAAIHLEQLL